MRIPFATLRRSAAPALAAALLASPGSARACAVCFGQAGDPLVEGAKAGVIFLAICIYALLMMCVGVVAIWAVRARRLARAEAEAEGDPLARAATGPSPESSTA